MSSFSNIYRLSNLVIGNNGYKSVLNGRSNFVAPYRKNILTNIQLCNYTKKSAEEKLGIDKPKRPLTPFFKFMSQMRPALLAKNPGISSKEAISWTSKHWQQLDADTKAQMGKEYEKDREDYKKIKAIYEASLTSEQKEDIKRLKEEIAASKEKRKLKAEFKELGRPKKPMSSYFLFMQSKKDLCKGKTLLEQQEKLKAEWAKLDGPEKTKFDKQALDLMVKYKKDLEAWELKMISMGRMDLVRSNPVREKKPKPALKQE